MKKILTESQLNRYIHKMVLESLQDMEDEENEFNSEPNCELEDLHSKTDQLIYKKVRKHIEKEDYDIVGELKDGGSIMLKINDTMLGNLKVLLPHKIGCKNNYTKVTSDNGTTIIPKLYDVYKNH